MDLQKKKTLINQWSWQHSWTPDTSLSNTFQPKLRRDVGYASDLLAEVPKAEEASVKEEVKEELEDKNSIFDCLEGDVEVDLTGTDDNMDDEISLYQAEPGRVRDPLQWWMGNENRYCVALFFSNFITITHKILIVTSLAKEVMFLVALVCLFFCLFVDNITQKVTNGLR